MDKVICKAFAYISGWSGASWLTSCQIPSHIPYVSEALPNCSSLAKLCPFALCMTCSLQEIEGCFPFKCHNSLKSPECPPLSNLHSQLQIEFATSFFVSLCEPCSFPGRLHSTRLCDCFLSIFPALMYLVNALSE